jgi:hypothetical protein
MEAPEGDLCVRLDVRDTVYTKSRPSAERSGLEGRKNEGANPSCPLLRSLPPRWAETGGKPGANGTRYVPNRIGSDSWTTIAFLVKRNYFLAKVS